MQFHAKKMQFGEECQKWNTVTFIIVEFNVRTLLNPEATTGAE